MNRIFSRVLALGIAALAVGAALPACAKNDKSIFIRNVVAPPASRQNGSCLYVVDTNAPGLFRGTLDIAFSQSYSPVMLVGNQLITRADPLDPRAESNRVHLKGVVSRVTDPNGNQLNELTGNATGFADAAANSTPGFGLFQATTIDVNTINALKAQKPFTFGDRNDIREVLTQVRAFGTTLGGEDVESGEFQFVVDVCYGCLVSFDSDPAAAMQPNCKKAVDTAATSLFACTPGQDEPSDCHFCQDPLCAP